MENKKICINKIILTSAISVTKLELFILWLLLAILLKLSWFLFDDDWNNLSSNDLDWALMLRIIPEKLTLMSCSITGWNKPGDGQNQKIPHIETKECWVLWVQNSIWITKKCQKKYLKYFPKKTSRY